jgi:broad specificity phosphatase PhoE
MSEIYLIRHGQASFGAEDYDRLSPLGVHQSQVLAGYLHATGFRPDVVYAGPLSRHKATADVLHARYAEEMPLPELEILDGFNEYDAKAIIQAAMKVDASLVEDVARNHTQAEWFKKVFGKAVRLWVTGKLSARGVETWEELRERVAGSLATIRNRHGSGTTIAIFTSGGPIAASLSHALGLSGMDAMRLNGQIVNTSITRYVYDSKRFTLAGFNSIAHLKLACDPSLITYW